MTYATETAFDFDYKYTPGERATRDYPGDGADVEITVVRLNGVTIPIEALTTDQYQEMVEQVIENH